MKDLFELKLGSMTMDEYERILLELFQSMLTSSRMNMSRFKGSLSGFPSIFNEKIQYDDPK
jgi:hypothetical protein